MESQVDIAALQNRISDLLSENLQLKEALRRQEEEMNSTKEPYVDPPTLSSVVTEESAIEMALNQQNPLLLDPVATMLGGYLSYKSLANGRQVCLKWNECLTPRFASRSEKFLDASSNSEDEIDKFSKELLSVYPPSEYEASNEISVSIPSTLSLRVSTQEQHRGTQLLLQWLQTFGTEVRELELFAEKSGESMPVDLLNDVISKFQNLKAFCFPCPYIQGRFSDHPLTFPTIKTLKIGLDHDSHYLPEGHIIWTDNLSSGLMKTMGESVRYLMSVTPNLTTLGLSRAKTFPSTEIFPLPSSYMENISELYLHDEFASEDILIPLSNVGFKSLKKLTVEKFDPILQFFYHPPHNLNPASFPSPNPFGPAVNKLLASVSPTLQQLSLKLHFHAVEPLEEAEAAFNEEEEELDDPMEEARIKIVRGKTLPLVPSMPQLKSLEIHTSFDMEEGSIDFLEKFPKLESLVMSCKGSSETLFRLFPNQLGFQHRSLRTFKLPEISIVNRPFQPEVYWYPPFPTLTLIRNCFPNLEVLSIALPDYPYTSRDADERSPRFCQDLCLLDKFSQLTELFISCGDIDSDVFQKSMSKLLNRKKLGFYGLRRFHFNCRGNPAVLKLTTMIKSLRNVPFLQYLELQNFNICPFEKKIYEAAEKLNRVRFVNCRVVTVKQLGTKISRKVQAVDLKAYGLQLNYIPQQDKGFELGTSTGIHS